MDEIVRQAMAKWPNVPHCYGWLALDARGNWRMRDERAQALKLPGDRIGNAALLAFINRNYLHDERGRWYFQNGPQRVYVNLDAAPYIARTEPQQGFVLHTGEPLPPVDAAWMTEGGQLVLRAGDRIALVDDRDMAQCLPLLKLDGSAAADEDLLGWLEAGTRGLTLAVGDRVVAVERITTAELPARFGFVAAPQPDGQ
ncbi:DUF2946 family protein [Noviherbaspirillum aridicola]|uniref:DUF2946 family protein n=1 Tax=Noviherbaspirillum aridicola TaxID=2849687 RepID=A0ABQ4Q7S9_9BURK|nr:DUF2946 family protein [Noviherbaspirillum aridicola]GIZ53203.1 hypothetical protein NCCP691_32170 [Noviherbaspirillum aridicola]